MATKAERLNDLRSRIAKHAIDLCGFCDGDFNVGGNHDDFANMASHIAGRIQSLSLDMMAIIPEPEGES